MHPNKGGEGGGEQLPVPENTGEDLVATGEVVPSHQESAPSKAPPPPVLSTDDLPIAGPVHLPSDDDSSTQPPAQIAAKDPHGQIEKQYVEKAKGVIAATKDDPFRQKNEISRVKADYIHRRFNKLIKTDNPIS